MTENIRYFEVYISRKINEPTKYVGLVEAPPPTTWFHREWMYYLAHTDSIEQKAIYTATPRGQ